MDLIGLMREEARRLEEAKQAASSPGEPGEATGEAAAGQEAQAAAVEAAVADEAAGAGDTG
jgi:hypothetical protein